MHAYATSSWFNIEPWKFSLHSLVRQSCCRRLAVGRSVSVSIVRAVGDGDSTLDMEFKLCSRHRLSVWLNIGTSLYLLFLPSLFASRAQVMMDDHALAGAGTGRILAVRPSAWRIQRFHRWMIRSAAMSRERGILGLPFPVYHHFQVSILCMYIYIYLFEGNINHIDPFYWFLGASQVWLHETISATRSFWFTRTLKE